MKKEQFEAISQWQKETFGEATVLSKVEHLQQEINELKEELIKDVIDGSSTESEFADCFILLFGAAASIGMNYEHICNCIEYKMTINRNRKWGKSDENGVINHIK